MKLQHTPPAWADRFLEWFCADDQLEILQGDLHELYHDRLESMPRWRADLYYFRDVLDMLRPFALKRKRALYTLNRIDMFKNYWKIGWRSLVKDRLFSLINVLSLALAIAVVAIIFLYLKQEYAFDKFHSKGEDIYRMARLKYAADGSIEERDIALPEPLARAVQSGYPQVMEAARLWDARVLVHRDQDFIEEQALFTEPSFWKIFSFELLSGNAQEVLKDPMSIVITTTMADKYFKGEDAVGKTLDIRYQGQEYSYRIAGIAADPPANSSIRYQVLMPLSMLLSQYELGSRTVDNWNTSYLTTYVLLHPQADVAALNSQMDQLWKKHNAATLEFMTERGTWNEGARLPFSYHFQPLQTVHTDINFPGGITPPVDRQQYLILGGIALFVLLLGCINFTLLSMGIAGRRMREIGMRKTVGASRGQVILQFWSESCLTSLVALALALGIIYVALPLFNGLTQAQLTMNDFWQWENALILLLISLITGSLAGTYPSLVISSFKPVLALQSRGKLGKNSWFMKSLIVVQFTVSAFFIIGALVIDRQIHYMKTKNLGVNREGVMVVDIGDLEDRESNLFKQAISEFSFVESTSRISFRLPIYANAGWSYDGEGHKAYLLSVDRGFVETFGLKIVAGRNFQAEDRDSVNAVLVNEAFVSHMGWHDGTGQRILGYNRRGLTEPEVIGVVKDFHFQSLENEIQPMIITINPQESLNNMMVRMSTANIGTQVADITKQWKTLFPDKPLEYSFLEDDLEAEYASQEHWSSVLRLASGMNVFIACLGLFGFATLFLSGKLREIGIRKVFGGSTISIFGRMARQFVVLVAAGFILAVPLAWMVMQEWLEGFAFHIPLYWWIFALTAALLMLMALLAISYQVVRTRQVNPVVVLKEG